MSAAAIYPITDALQLAEHASYVHNAVYMTQRAELRPGQRLAEHAQAALTAALAPPAARSRGGRRGYIQAKMSACAAETARAGTSVKGELRGAARG